MLALAGCEDRSLPELSYKTEQAVIGTTFDEPLCEGDLRFVDERISQLELELDAPDGGRIEIYLYDEPPPQCRFVGCFVDGRYVAALWDFLDHELVHAVVAKFADPVDFWSEGVAEAMRPLRTQRGGSTIASNRGKDDDDLDYATVGHFTRWLILEHGGVANARRMITGDDFEAVYGMPFDDAALLYEETAPWSYPAPVPCDGRALRSDGGDGYAERVTIDCAAPDTSQFLGPGTTRIFEVLADAAYQLDISGGLGVRLIGCQTEVLASPPPPVDEPDVYNEADSALPLAAYFATDEGPHAIQLAAGSYRMMVLADREQNPNGGDVDVSLAPL